MHDVLEVLLVVACMYKITHSINVRNNFKCFVHVKHDILSTAGQKYVIVTSNKPFYL